MVTSVTPGVGLLRRCRI